MSKNVVTKAFAHIIVWLLFFALVVSVSTSMGNTTFGQQLSSGHFLIFCFIYVSIFYFNNSLLFPRYYLQKKYFIYFLAMLLLLAAVVFIKPFDNLVSQPEAGRMGPVNFQPLPPPRDSVFRPRDTFPPRHFTMRPGPQPPRPKFFLDQNSIILFFLVWIAGVALQISRQWRTSEQKAILAEKDKNAAELAFLKAHINPHFLFNTLNNIYSLAITRDGQTPASILKLSNIMRYVTESAATDFIALENEVECMVDFIDLQKLRLNKKVYLDFSITGSTQNKVIAPLLLLPFVENVFKYGISNHHPSTIIIKLFIEENTITFYSQNKIFNAGYVYDRGGVGLSNTRRRLEYLYPGKYELDIKTENGFYTVQLTLHTA
ncbi:MAG TPA: sensor histidine kinase [Chitinophagaceae bacterium]|nr:sensor histidine kinase [Chitinophagaceae bacterium]